MNDVLTKSGKKVAKCVDDASDQNIQIFFLLK